MPAIAPLQVFESGRQRLSFRVWGNGPQALLAFHGFGQSSQVFESLAAAAGQQFTIFSIDLFLHGNSTFDGNLPTKTDWQQLIESFLTAQRIDRFSLLGFSMGGRFALALAETLAQRIDQLILIAPDGITRNIWYRIATSTSIGRALFRFFLDHLPLLHGFGHVLTRLGLLHKTALRFADVSLGTPAQRALVYGTWTGFRLIQPDLLRIAQALNSLPVRVRFFTGVYDRIVPGTYILPLTNRLRQYEMTVLKTGHNRLIELAASHLSATSTPVAALATNQQSKQ